MRRSSRARGSSGPSVSSGVSKYASALLDPFAERGHGAQVPDLYSFPTASKHITSSFQVTLSGSGTFSIVILPHPFQTIWASCKFTGITSILSGGGGVVTTDGTAATPGGCMGSLIGITQLATYFDKYRVVGMGARITNLMSATTATGRLYFATFPCPKNLVPSGLINNIGSAVSTFGPVSIIDMLKYIGGPAFDGTNASAGITQNILSCSTGGEIPLPALIQSGIEWRNKIVSPDAYSFRSGELQGDTNLTFKNAAGVVVDVGVEEAIDLGISSGAANTDADTTFAFQKSGKSDFDMVGGWEFLCLRGSGFPTGADTVVLNIDITMHLEGTEDMSATSAAGFASDATIPPVEPGALQALQTMAARLPSVKPCASGSSLAMTLPIRGF